MRDVAGKTFGRLTIIKPTDKRCNNNVVWECKCECGNTVYVPTYRLTKRITKSCGCLRVDRAQETHRLNLINKQFGRLTVVSPTTTHATNGALVWECKCTCKETVYVPTDRLISGRTQSCGCLQRESTSNRADFKNGTMLLLLSKNTAYKNNKHSNIRGVTWSKSKKKWLAKICLNYHTKFLGYFDDIDDAAAARRKAERELYDPLLKKYGYSKDNKKPKSERKSKNDPR